MNVHCPNSLTFAWGPSFGGLTARAGLLTIAVLCFWSSGQAKRAQRDKAVGASVHRMASSNIARTSQERTGEMATRDGLRLRLIADQADISIRTIKEGSSGENTHISYRVRIETDARTANAKEMLKQYVLSVRSTPAGVLIFGEMPKGAFREHVAGDFPALLSRVRVNFQVSVPRNYSLDVQTQAGNIETQDINGTVSLITRGGNIVAGRIGSSTSQNLSPAVASMGKLQGRLETQGGHIFVSDVAGDLRAITAGGHISAGNISGDATLRSGGGHIRAGEITGPLQIDTAGGNISVQHAGASVSASTTGGQIDFGEASGSVRAHTGGGGIRILHVAGPIQLETNDGSICLTRVQGSVRASTGAGTITAWINPEVTSIPQAAPPAGGAPAPPVAIPRGMRIPRPGPAGGIGIVKLSGPSQLESGQGDIVVFLPRYLAANIEATIEKAADHRIETDPELALKVLTQGSAGTRSGNTIRAEGALNGGGELLRLRTVSGNIRLKYFDSDPALHEMLMHQQRTRLERQKKILEQRAALERSRGSDLQSGNRTTEPGQAVEANQALETDHTGKSETNTSARVEDIEQRMERDPSLFEQLGRKIEMRVLGGVRVNPEELQKHLISRVTPQYPELARHASIEGMVRLEIQVNKDGTVGVRRAVAGERLLVDAAIDAVKRWRYAPVVLEGRPVNAISTVALEFTLH